MKRRADVNKEIGIRGIGKKKVIRTGSLKNKVII
jgi:hypothetical protein